MLALRKLPWFRAAVPVRYAGLRKPFRTPRPTGNLNFDIEYIVNTLYAYKGGELAKHISSLCNRPALQPHDRAAICTRGLELLCNSKEPIQYVLRAMIRNQPLFASAQVHGVSELRVFTERILAELADLPDDKRSHHDVLDATTLLCYNLHPTPSLIAGLQSIESLVSREIPLVKNTQMLMLLLRFAAHRDNVDIPEMACPDLVPVIFKQLGHMTGPIIAPRSDNTALVTLRCTDVVSKAAVLDTSFLQDFDTKLAAMLKLGAMKSVVEASHVAYMFSLYGHQSMQNILFRRIRRIVDDRQRTELRARSIQIYIRLNWAFQAQGLDMPMSSRLAMVSYFQANPYSYDPMLAREVQLLYPILTRSRTDIRQLMLEHAGDTVEQRSLVAAVSALEPTCLSDVWLACGVVPILALVPEDESGAFQPWPANLPPDKVTKGNLQKLSHTAKPVALFLVEGRYLFSLPKNKWNNVVECQREILVKLGWRVVVLPMPELNCLTTEQAAEECVKIMRNRHRQLPPPPQLSDLL